jgi:hypothetical protein
MEEGRRLQRISRTAKDPSGCGGRSWCWYPSAQGHTFKDTTSLMQER